MIYIIEVVFAIGMCFQSLFFIEVIIACIIAEHLYRAAGSCTVVPLAYVVTVSSRSGNRECRNVLQRLALIGIDNKALYQSAIDIKEVYGKLVLHVLDSIVGEVRGSKGQRICILCLFKHGINGRANIIDECVVRTLVLCCERNGDFCITLVEYRAYQIKGVDLFIIAVCSGGGPLCLFIQNGGNNQSDLLFGLVLEHTNYCIVIKHDGYVASTGNVFITCNHDHQVCTAFHLCQLQSRSNVHECAQAIAVCNILIEVYLIIVAVLLNTNIMRNSFKDSRIGCMLGSRNDSGSPACEYIGVLQIQSLSGIVDHGRFTVSYFHIELFTVYNKGDGCGIDRYVGSITGNSRKLTGNQVAVRILPTLEIQSRQSAVMVRNLTKLMRIGELIIQNLKCNGISGMCGILCIYRNILTGHGGNHFTVFIYPSKISIFNSCILTVECNFRTVRQEAFKNHIALCIHISDGVQVRKGYGEGNVRGDVTSGNVVTQRKASAVRGNGYVIQNALEPCTGVISGAESKAELAVTLVGIGQLSILELFRDEVIDQIDCAVSVIVSLLCLSRIGNSVLEIGKCLNHARNDLLCTNGADVQLACNTCSSLVKQLVANQSICILDLSQSRQLIVADHLGQVINRLYSNGSVFAVDRFGSLFNQDISILLKQLKCRTCSFDLLQNRSFLLVHSIYVIEQILNNRDKLVILKQVKQLKQLANCCTFAHACNNGLLGAVRNVCIIECLCQHLSEYAGNENLNVQITVSSSGIADCCLNSLCGRADQLQVTLQSYAELKAVILLALCTQNDVIGCQNAVIANVSNVCRSNGI